MSFWSWYAQVSDSIRHQVVEQGWFGRQTTPNISPTDMPALDEKPAEHHKPPQPEPEI